MKYNLFLSTFLAAAFLAFGSAWAQPQLSVGYWTFDNEDLTDQSGNENHGFAPEGIAFSLDVPEVLSRGKSVEFNGLTRIEIPCSASLEIAEELTISFWIKAELERQIDDYPTVLAKHTDINAPGWRIDGHREIGIRWMESRHAEIFDGLWHHVAFVYDGQTVAVYVDGIPVGGNVPKKYSTEIQNTADLVMGARITDRQLRPFVGQLDEVAIFDIALSHDQINQLSDGTPANKLQ